MNIKQKLMVFAAGSLLGFGLTPAALASLADKAEIQDWRALEASLSSDDINAAQPDGMNALLWAVYYNESSAVKMLLDAGADPNVRNRYGIAPLLLAGQNANAEIVRFLLNAGADPNTKAPEGDTALMNAARAGNPQAVQALLDSEADVNARDGHLGQTALMWAAGENHATVVEMLLENGADVDAISTELDWKDVPNGNLFALYPLGGLSALHHAARENSFEAVAVLLAYGADPNLKDPQGLSPVRIAAANAHFDITRMLIDSGADINEGVLPDLTKVLTRPIRRSGTKRFEQTSAMELIEMLFDMGADVDSIATSALPKKDGFGYKDDFGGTNETALYIAAFDNDAELMRFFIERGANLSSNNGRNGDLPLIAALDLSNPGPAPGIPMGTPEERPNQDAVIAIAEMFIAAGVDINASTNSGATALHNAAEDGNEVLVKFLIDNGADMSLKDNSNRTPLDVANAVPRVRMAGAGRPPVGPAPIRQEHVLALLRTEMESAGIPILPYEAPPQAEDLAESVSGPATEG